MFEPFLRDLFAALLVDPFVRAGTCLVSAVGARMRFIGDDISRQTLYVCRVRTAEAFNPKPKIIQAAKR
jgi:hypothetical protein